MGLHSMADRARSLSTVGVARRILAGVAPLSFAMLMLCIGANDASAQEVRAFGNVYPADNPFTSVDEGIPVLGNRVRTTEAVDHQTFFEGSNNPGTNLGDPADDFNVNYNVFVGRDPFATGTLRILLNAQLRDMNLVIGDQARSTGTMIIDGNGSLYNNDPLILPPGLPPAFSSVNPRVTAAALDGLDDYENGFDMYVGRSGSGTLRITGGGRAEIHDAVIIADQPSSNGTIVVDGIGSTLTSGSFSGPASVQFIPRQMFVGRLGIGSMTISNGGQVMSEGPPSTDGSIEMGAVIGGNPFDENEDEPQPGGRGTVTLTGADSKWIINGSLQIGGFNIGEEINGDDDLEGERAIYTSEAGHGTLYVGEGTLVDVGFELTSIPDSDLAIVIGRFGLLDMAGGLVSLADPGTRTDNVQFINDGVIRGRGRIETGLFQNRFLGEIRVGPNDKLVIDSSSEFELNSTDAEPFANWGVIQVIGTAEQRAELEIERAPNAPPDDPIRPFRNLQVLNAPPEYGRQVGQITAAHSTLRFRSGLSNAGKLSFTAGDNFVSGPVVNEAGDPGNGIPSGEVSISGNNTTVTFENHFVNNGRFHSFPNTSLVLFQNDFTQGPGGVMTMTLGGNSPSAFQTSYLSIMGDASLSGTLEIDLRQTGTNPLTPVAGDEFEIIEAMGALSGIFTSFVPPVGLAPGLVMFPEYDYLLGTVTLIVANGLPNSPDFNNDGVIDGLDFDIWFANQGIISGATVQQGDADGDGDVDVDDLFFWQRNVGQPPPWNGAGAGSGAGGGFAVPEPSALALLVVGSMLSSVARRRREP